ncbi:cytochrome b5 type B-like [Petaurus breviceps papuanus]|uniref:cytochrome b5 type B-like n=1 Tax=Petaurus breviceps papuanus TaxID=3040969 RepID=UPI0036DD0921
MEGKGGSGSMEGKEPELESGVTYYQLQEVVKLNLEKHMWMVIHGRVNDITRFPGEHLGREEVLIEQTDRDVTGSFEGVGLSSNAKKMLKQYSTGELHPSDCKGKGSENSGSLYKSCWSNWIIPIVGAVLLGIMYRFYKGESKLS